MKITSLFIIASCLILTTLPHRVLLITIP